MERLLIIDGNGLVHRGFHALPRLTSPDKRLVNAVYGFFLAFLKALNDIKPDYACACFDLAKPTFRHKKFKEYKAQRKKTTKELLNQIPIVKEVLEIMRVPIYSKEGFEADDVIATICEIAKNKEGLETIIVSSDLDILQLVGDNVKVYAPQKGGKKAVVYNEDKVWEKYGFAPELLADYRGLKGDESDNIPGVKGIGEKTAMGLLQQFGPLEKIYEAVKNNKPGISERAKGLLMENKTAAFFSRELAELRKDAPIDFELEKCRISNANKGAIIGKFKQLGFATLISRLPGNAREQKGLF